MVGRIRVRRVLTSCACAVVGASLAVGPARAESPPPLGVVSTPLAFSSPYRIDAQAPLSHGWYIKSLSCPTTTLCVAADAQGNLLTTTDPTAPPSGWDRFSIGSYGESEVACPTASLCVALGDDQGNATVLDSTDPTGGAGAWQSGALPDAGPSAVSLTCPTASFCAALTSNGTIVTTDDPAGGASTWTSSPLSANGGGGSEGMLSCPSASLCVLSGGYQGTLYTSTDPTGGPSAWSEGEVGTPIGRISCPTTQLCVGVGLDGIGLEVSTDPAAGASSWSQTDLDPSTNTANGDPQVTCTVSSFCVVMDPDGSVMTSHDPAGGAAAWSTVAQVPVPIYGSTDGITWPAAPTCPEDQFCVAATAAGDVAVSTDPAGPSGSWPIHSVDGYNSLTGVSCTSDADCVAVDDAGNVLTSSQPELAQPWAAAHIDGRPLTSVSCIPGGACVAVDAAGDVLSSSDPAGGPSTWSTSDVDPGNDIFEVSCASGPVCMAVDYAGNVLLSTDPTGGEDAWEVANVLTPGNDSGFTGVSCADATLCIASTLDSLEIVENPGRAGSVWKAVSPYAVQPGGQNPESYSSISCPSATDCVATDGFDALTTVDPTASASAWSASQISYYNFAGPVTCASPSLCLSLGPGVIYETSTPTADYMQWPMGAPETDEIDDGVNAASCSSPDFCLVVGNLGEAWAGEGSGYTAPPGGGSTGAGPGGGSGSGSGPGGDPGSGTSGSGSSSSAPSAPSAPSSPSAPAGSGAGAGSAAGGSAAGGSAAGGSAQTSAPPAARRSAAVRLRLQPLALTSRIVRARISCTAVSGRCAGTVTLSASARRPWVLASARFDVRAGRAETVSFALSHRTAELLRRRHVRRLLVRAAVRARSQAGSTSAASRIS